MPAAQQQASPDQGRRFLCLPLPTARSAAAVGPVHDCVIDQRYAGVSRASHPTITQSRQKHPADVSEAGNIDTMAPLRDQDQVQRHVAQVPGLQALCAIAAVQVLSAAEHSEGFSGRAVSRQGSMAISDQAPVYQEVKAAAAGQHIKRSSNSRVKKAGRAAWSKLTSSWNRLVA
jgi:hypothetical protein